MFARKPANIRFARTKLKSTESKVQPHLAYDLRDVDALVAQGKSVSNQNVEGMYYDGEQNISFNMPQDRMRGVDINDAWNAMMDGKRRVSRAGVRSVDLSNLKTS